jgi:hypothetical protein
MGSYLCPDRGIFELASSVHYKIQLVLTIVLRHTLFNF